MKKHLVLVDDVNLPELVSMHQMFETAIGSLGILPDEARTLVRRTLRIASGRRSSKVALKILIRRLSGLAIDARALLAGDDEVREWVRSPNPGLWTDTLVATQLSPLRAMMDYADGVRVIHDQVKRERRREDGLPELRKRSLWAARGSRSYLSPIDTG